MIKHCHVMDTGKRLGHVALESLGFCESEMMMCKILIITRRREGTCRPLEIERTAEEVWSNCS